MEEICATCFDRLCNDCQENYGKFESHAVEVLAKKCYYNTELWDENRDMPEWEEIDESRKNKHRAEARELLGVK